MDETPAPPSLSFLWALGFLVMLVSAHVAISYLRRAARVSDWRGAAVPMGVAAAACGTGWWSAMLLALGSQGLRFPLSFGLNALVMAWIVAALVAAAALSPWLRWPRPWAVVLGGVLLALGALATQWLVLRAAALQPFVPLRRDALSLAAPLCASGAISGLWLALLGRGGQGRWRRRWRWAAAALLAIGVFAGQEMVITAGELGQRAGSTPAHPIPVVAVALVAGIGVPMLLAFLEANLGLIQPVVEGLVPRRRKRGRAKRPVL